MNNVSKKLKNNTKQSNIFSFTCWTWVWSSCIMTYSILAKQVPIYFFNEKHDSCTEYYMFQKCTTISIVLHVSILLHYTINLLLCDWNLTILPHTQTHTHAMSLCKCDTSQVNPPFLLFIHIITHQSTQTHRVVLEWHSVHVFSTDRINDDSVCDEWR